LTQFALVRYVERLLGLAPTAIKQRDRSRHSRRGRCAGFFHDPGKRSDRLCRMGARQRSNICWCLSHLAAFRSRPRDYTPLEQLLPGGVPDEIIRVGLGPTRWWFNCIDGELVDRTLARAHGCYLIPSAVPVRDTLKIPIDVQTAQCALT